MTTSPERDHLIELQHSRPVEKTVLQDDTKRRGEFAIRLVELADDFDHLDHEFGPVGGSELQADCQAVRELAQKLIIKNQRASR